MKKSKIITTILVSTSVLLSGCEKFLIRDNPTGITDDRFWRVESDLTSYLETIYNNAIPAGALITDGGTYQANSLMQMSGITDEGVSRANFGSWQNFPIGLLTPSDGYISDVYRYNYANISDCSRILENYQNVYIANDELKKRYAAEARALRAYAHLKLYEFFGVVPIVDHSIKFSDEDAKNLPRPTEADLVAFISRELDEAAKDLPTSYNVDQAYRMSRGACHALQVRLYMNNKNYPKAIEYAKKLIDLNVYQLWKSNSSKNSYASLFSYDAQNNSERILFRRAGNKGIAGRMGPASVVANGQATISATGALINTYETKQGKNLNELPADSIAIYKKTPNYNNNRDPRLSTSVLLPGARFVRPYDPFNNATDLVGKTFATVTGALCTKYLQEEDYNKGFGGATINFMVIRYAEILLSYVEALVESGDWQNPDVKKYLNEIRNRAGLPTYNEAIYNSQAKIRELYRRERFLELAFEGTRLIDIRRWRIGTEVLNGPAYGLIDPKTNEVVKVEDRVFDANRDYLWPIPQTEINNNTGLNGQNNPGW
ncbi:RagB/SusD family nutrient uptake outer membrane protein [Sphingobacterium sp. DK4209]|uniref:RagB/SusD family nutrient uptake outer membrane protein n=1 Tax=Sphingobacterium zhuxiongii TaxID=2662364 RepID=A0A5Q0Q799_9SPHI|nr:MULTISPECIES: RagB/SusD family nutrient uptake outer membrane protein [unclassified Sphingobacterium]MVZ66993.1 RagB/SusD family nutrient uptake outer membrane protein [Sphingobacterium sp. DK4209]QGA25947.1 RagB/SusD family nutrient uptake outer membrane protein [Sphingobacterium sp. dk4302]